MIDEKLLNEIVILECTLRDGSYAIDFKFTEQDTTVLTEQLAKLNFRWIEVGHGLGVNAAAKGKGDALATDEEFIYAAKQASNDILCGMFCIPEIANLKHLEKMKAAGLDFVRIGCNAPYAEEAFDYVMKAKELGLIPILNFMKTYAITPKEFAKKAKQANDIGAEVIYCVDSSGGMFPEDVARYIGEARQACDCHLGFHGHNNLQLAVANCIQAYKSGARFIDGTLYGIGRSAGNAPTEVLVAVFENMGVSTKIDLFDLMDVAEDYFRPLMTQINMYDMMGVTAGYSKFHSSFLPKILKHAKKYCVDPRRLAAAMGKKDTVSLDDEYLESTAKDLANTVLRPSPKSGLIRFSSRKISQDTINNTLEGVKELIRAMEAVGAKMQSAKKVIELVPTLKEDNWILPEFIFMNERIILGRVSYGSLQMLKQIIELSEKNIFAYFIDKNFPKWAKDSFDILVEDVGKNKIIPIHRSQVYRDFLQSIVDILAMRLDKASLLVYGYDEAIMGILSESDYFNQVFCYDPSQGHGFTSNSGNVVMLTSKDDWRSINLKFEAILCVKGIDSSDIKLLRSVIAQEGLLCSLVTSYDAQMRKTFEEKYIQIDFGRMYSGILERYVAVLTLLDT
jgi:4-hydroxy 2-oxovalerate aldolase